MVVGVSSWFKKLPSPSNAIRVTRTYLGQVIYLHIITGHVILCKRHNIKYSITVNISLLFSYYKIVCHHVWCGVQRWIDLYWIFGYLTVQTYWLPHYRCGWGLNPGIVLSVIAESARKVLFWLSSPVLHSCFVYVIYYCLYPATEDSYRHGYQ